MSSENIFHRYWRMCKRIFIMIIILGCIMELYMILNPIEEGVYIKDVDFSHSGILIENRYDNNIDLSGWMIVDKDTNSTFVFPNGAGSYIGGKDHYATKSYILIMSEGEKDYFYSLNGNEQYNLIKRISNYNVGAKLMWWPEDRVLSALGSYKTLELYNNEGKLVDSYKY